MRFHTVVLSLATATAALSGCGTDDPPAEPVFPADFRESFTRVRECRLSVEHELEFVELYIAPEFVEPYERCVTEDVPCPEPLPEGTLVVKAQFSDEGCTDYLRATASLRLESGRLGAADAWRWQEVDAHRRVTVDGADPSCVGCHTHSCQPAYDLRCVMDP